MTRIIERVEAHYESREVPFSKTYELQSMGVTKALEMILTPLKLFG